jgi:hypothetical protein
MFRQIISAAIKISTVGPVVVPVFANFICLHFILYHSSDATDVARNSEELVKAYQNVKFIVQK